MKLNIISCDTLQQYLGREDVLLLDLRDPVEYNAGHYPGAHNIRAENLEETIDTLVLASAHPIYWIILYCDHGNISLLSARDLTKDGYPVMSLGGGYEGCRG